MEELIPITMFLCITAVAILRPISKRLGGLLEAITRERTAVRADGADTEIIRVRSLVEHIARRIDLVEERLDFTERLLSGSHRRSSFARPEPMPAREQDFLRP